MFSMAVTGLAKSLIVVTASLHPVAAAPAPAHYTVRPGDTLTGIARHEYGSAADWPALWWINRHAVPDPDVLAAGQRLRLSAWHPRQAWLDRAARAAIPAPARRPASAPTTAAAATTGRRQRRPRGPRPQRPRPRGPRPRGPRPQGLRVRGPRAVRGPRQCGDLACGDLQCGDRSGGDLQCGAGQLPGVRDRPRVRRKRPGRQPGLGCGRPVRVPARHLAEPGVFRAAARRARQRAERGIPAGIRPVGHQPMGTLRRVLTNRSSGDVPARAGTSPRQRLPRTAGVQAAQEPGPPSSPAGGRDEGRRAH